MCDPKKFSYSPLRKDRKFLEAGPLKDQNRVLFYGCDIVLLFCIPSIQGNGSVVFSKVFQEAGRAAMETTRPKFTSTIQLQTEPKTIFTSHNVSSTTVHHFLTDYKYSFIVDLSAAFFAATHIRWAVTLSSQIFCLSLHFFCYPELYIHH